MKSLFTLCFIVIFSLASRAGFIIGYQGGIWMPGLSNVQCRTFVNEKKYGADYGYNRLFHGVYIGMRKDFKKGWIELSWNNRHNVFTSEYTNDGVRMKDSYKPKMNTLVICGGYKVKKWGFGFGFDPAYFNVKEKKATVDQFASAQWYDAFGKPIAIIPILTYPAFDICIERQIDKNIIIKAAYLFGIGSVKFWNNDEIMPKNITLSFLINLKKSKSN